MFAQVQLQRVKKPPESFFHYSGAIENFQKLVIIKSNHNSLIVHMNLMFDS